MAILCFQHQFNFLIEHNLFLHRGAVDLFIIYYGDAGWQIEKLLIIYY
jgi:hypothetical protein